MCTTTCARREQRAGRAEPTLASRSSSGGAEQAAAAASWGSGPPRVLRRLWGPALRAVRRTSEPQRSGGWGPGAESPRTRWVGSHRGLGVGAPSCINAGHGSRPASWLAREPQRSGTGVVRPRARRGRVPACLGVGAPSSTLAGLGPARELATPASPSGAAVGARGLQPPRERSPDRRSVAATSRGCLASAAVGVGAPRVAVPVTATGQPRAAYR